LRRVIVLHLEIVLQVLLRVTHVIDRAGRDDECSL